LLILFLLICSTFCLPFFSGPFCCACISVMNYCDSGWWLKNQKKNFCSKKLFLLLSVRRRNKLREKMFLRQKRIFLWVWMCFKVELIICLNCCWEMEWRIFLCGF
jgi:hypothetical protein